MYIERQCTDNLCACKGSESQKQSKLHKNIKLRKGFVNFLKAAGCQKYYITVKII